MLDRPHPHVRAREQDVSRIEIMLTHHDHGPIWVAVWDEASLWYGERTWSCPDDPELGSFNDAEFEERPDQIEEALAQAAAPYSDDDRSCTMRCDPRAFQR